MANKLSELKELLLRAPIKGERQVYECTYVDNNCIVFAPTQRTGKTMLPTDLVWEWINHFEFDVIKPEMSCREMREIVKQKSDWSDHINNQESHLKAIVTAWANRAK